MPSGVVTIREATGPNAAAIQATVDAFRNDLGAPNNGNTPGTQPTGRREINWDGGGNDAAALAANAFAARGAIFLTPGSGFRVSGRAAGADPVRFGDLNPTYTSEFSVFSPEKLFTAIGSNITDVQFFVPGANTPAVTRGFGAVFTDVDVAGSTRLDFFDASGQLIFSRTVLPTPGSGSLSFLGVTFSNAIVSRVRIYSGNVAPGPNDAPPGTDVVVMDDFIYGEPTTIAGTPLVAAGAGPGGGPDVRLIDTSTGKDVFRFFAYDSGFRGGVRVALGDVNADGFADIITGAGPGGGPDVRVFSG